MVWISVSKPVTWDKFKFSAKTECIGRSMLYYVRSEPISFDNALRQLVEPDRADIKKWWKSLEVE